MIRNSKALSFASLRSWYTRNVIRHWSSLSLLVHSSIFHSFTSLLTDDVLDDIDDDDERDDDLDELNTFLMDFSTSLVFRFEFEPLNSLTPAFARTFLWNLVSDCSRQRLCSHAFSSQYASFCML